MLNYYPMCRLWPLLLVGGLLLPGWQYVSGIEIYTPSDLEATNGTDVKLKCTFTSTYPMSAKSVTVSWNFRPMNSGTDESVFYYQEKAYPPDTGRFKGHAVWSGDITRGDASITLHEVPPTFNGTFVCQVRNLPDVHGKNAEISFRVVDKITLTDISILAIIIGSAFGVILILFAIFVAVRLHRKRSMENDIELRPGEQEWKDTTVCAPEEAVPLKVVAKKEAESSDDEASEPSGGDADEEEDDDDEDEDDDGGGGDDD
ncbi:myelin protein zero-like protein 2b [Platichthys flesus]|uniref:myelin protein zero-like protein 2b n=1 Tax=Platichthys flesus TaxID=8260 RepID=UPI002DB97846|nr:myelin protein zero-like protein 2b [Platichthys flesus]